jgi:hypothetical protein
VVGHPIEGGQTTTVGLEPPQTGWLKPPMAIGGGSATPKAQTKKLKKKKKKIVAQRGWPDHPQGPWDGSATLWFFKIFFTFLLF